MFELKETSSWVFSILKDWKWIKAYNISNLVNALWKATTASLLKECPENVSPIEFLEAKLEEMNKKLIDDLNEEELEQNTKFAARKIWEHLFDIYWLNTKTVVIKEYKTRIDENNFKLAVSQFNWKDIEWYLKLIEENFIAYDKDWTNNFTETLQWIKTQEELNLLEFDALFDWEIDIEDIELNVQAINTEFLLFLHKSMFWEIYSWAWQIRSIEIQFWEKEWTKPHLIRHELEILFSNLEFRIKHINKRSLTELVDLITDFEYQFISIHPFQNTNWRMSRFLSKVILTKLWFATDNNTYSNRENRVEYLDAIKSYDIWEEDKLKSIIKLYLQKIVLDYNF